MSQYTGSATGGAVPQTVSRRNILIGRGAAQRCQVLQSATMMMTSLNTDPVSLHHHHQKRHQAVAVV